MNKELLGKYLKVGSIIKTKIDASPAWITNIVYSISDDFIQVNIGLEKNYIENLIMIGDTVKCKYTSNEIEIMFIGWVTKIHMDNPQRITIKVHQLNVFDNKRDYARYDVYLSAVIRKDRENKNGVFAILTNISKAGAAFIVRESIDLDQDYLKDSILYFEVNLTRERTFTFEGSFVRCDIKEKGIEYGVKYDYIEPLSIILLEEFLTELANEDKEFYNKRSGFWSKNSKMK
ncbi:PilZ domain-containing protein [Pseudobacteroides cellulosolvens]|uniref:Type IV pilus assembly PilZ n=1 Tax=Pseudobacteroides cellulosolvens ATCC 35603 = DSM 2933 TaxID=398512 RepID=A0A0L6JHB7_9FIRM|nr:PilZ domain-containing protein [Pseudobacteroides cellulosolvens]KNY24867.1 type IV pilus assembly PilZ [Pseudobacteroides cellulosolvens ATCC 35603 = DSM 2933]